MPSNWEDKFVKCPFYRKSENNTIICEGLAERNSIHLAFESKLDKRKYMEHRCNGVKECRTCPIHSLLEAKWE